MQVILSDLADNQCLLQVIEPLPSEIKVPVAHKSATVGAYTIFPDPDEVSTVRSFRWEGYIYNKFSGFPLGTMPIYHEIRG